MGHFAPFPPFPLSSMLAAAQTPSCPTHTTNVCDLSNIDETGKGERGGISSCPIYFCKWLSLRDENQFSFCVAKATLPWRNLLQRGVPPGWSDRPWAEPMPEFWSGPRQTLLLALVYCLCRAKLAQQGWNCANFEDTFACTVFGSKLASEVTLWLFWDPWEVDFLTHI